MKEEQILNYRFDIEGNKYWFNSAGLRHRDNDLPAIENVNGNKYWYQNGRLHRDNDKPSIERTNGTKEWWNNDVFVRITGL